MEEKERYEVMSPSLNGYAYIHDLKTDNVLNTYDSCDLLNQQSKRIKELEEENKTLIEALNGEVFINYKLPMENAQLKQQLAEKKKEIADLQSQLQQANEIINNPDTLIFQQQELIDNLQITIKEKNKKQNQKEIEQLEKIINLFEPYENEEKDTILCANNGTSFLEYIDNQINQLKEGK